LNLVAHLVGYHRSHLLAQRVSADEESRWCSSRSHVTLGIFKSNGAIEQAGITPGKQTNKQNKTKKQASEQQTKNKKNNNKTKNICSIRYTLSVNKQTNVNSTCATDTARGTHSFSVGMSELRHALLFSRDE
jgi:hypothetical protein